MEDSLSLADKQSIISSFLEIAFGQTADTATQFLKATGWKLDEAIQLFYVGNEGGPMVSSSYSPPGENLTHSINENLGSRQGTGSDNAGQIDEVRAPLPVIREALYDDPMFYGPSRSGFPAQEPSPLNFLEDMRQAGIWAGEQGTAENSEDKLASLYRPPFELMHHGHFEQAKVAASVQDKWLLVNLQSTKEFSSHMLNRDTWGNKTVAQTVKNNFIFWQAYDDSTEGRKVCTYYKVNSVPIVLVIDPITGQKMRSWTGMIQPDRLLEDLVEFMDGGPKNHHVSLSHKRPRESYMVAHRSQAAEAPVTADDINGEDKEMQRALEASLGSLKDTGESTCKGEMDTNVDKEEQISTPEKLTYPPLPEEPKGDRNLLCRVGVRLPDGRRVQRNFLKADVIQLLWAFCCSLLKEAEMRPFRLTQAIPGALKTLDYESKMTFEESGLSNSMVSMTWD